jgi:hypothetical protein
MEDAVARRERLKALKAAADASGTAQPIPEKAEPEKPVLKFRNYAVRDKKIEHEQVGSISILCPCSSSKLVTVDAVHRRGGSAQMMQFSAYMMTTGCSCTTAQV